MADAFDDAIPGLKQLVADAYNTPAAEVTIAWDEDTGWRVQYLVTGDYNPYQQLGTSRTSLADAIRNLKES